MRKVFLGLGIVVFVTASLFAFYHYYTPAPQDAVRNDQPSVPANSAPSGPPPGQMVFPGYQVPVAETSSGSLQQMQDKLNGVKAQLLHYSQRAQSVFTPRVKKAFVVIVAVMLISIIGLVIRHKIVQHQQLQALEEGMSFGEKVKGFVFPSDRKPTFLEVLGNAYGLAFALIVLFIMVIISLSIGANWAAISKKLDKFKRFWVRFGKAVRDLYRNFKGRFINHN